jgi:hypothetical protein
MTADVVPVPDLPSGGTVTETVVSILVLVGLFVVLAFGAGASIGDRDLKPENVRPSRRPRSPYREASAPSALPMEYLSDAPAVVLPEYAVRAPLMLPKTSGGQDVEC